MARKKQRNRRGRPLVYGMPEQIPDTPRNVMAAIVKSKPKRPDEWKYQQDAPNELTEPDDPS